MNRGIAFDVGWAIFGVEGVLDPGLMKPCFFSNFGNRLVPPLGQWRLWVLLT